MKKEASKLIKAKRLSSLLIQETSIHNTPNKEKIHFQDNLHKIEEKKQEVNLYEININKAIDKTLFENVNQNSVSIYPEENYISSKSKSKDIINKLMMKTIDDKKFVEKIKYIKHKLYVNYGYPYKKIKYKLKDGETRPLTCDYYEINRILNKSKCRLVSKFHDYSLELNDKEYLIRYSPRKEYYIIMKYLLYFVYAYDRITYCQYCQKHYDLDEIKLRYYDLLSNNNNLEGPSNENIDNNTNKKKIMNKRASIFDFNFNKFKASMESKNASKNNKIFISSNSNKNIKKRFTIDFSGLNQIENNFYSRNSTFLNNFINKKEVNNNINDFYVGLGNINNFDLISCKLTKPINLFIEKIPFKLIPNCTPNLFPSSNKILKILHKFINNFKKLKLNLYQSGNTKKPKRIWYDEMYYHQFIKEISFSSENFYSHDDNLEEIIKTNHFHYHNENRRMKFDDDIKDLENLIISIDESPKKAKANILNKNKNNIISKNDIKSIYDDKSSSQNKKGSKKNTIKINGLIKDKNDKKSNRNQSSFSSFKSNNYISSLTSSKIEDNINESKNKVNKRNDETIKINNNSSKLIKSNLEKDNKYFELSNKYLNERMKIKENKKFQTLKNYHSQVIKDSHYIYYINKSNSKLNSTKSLYKKGFKNNNFNKKYRISSTRPNKMKLKKDFNKNLEYIPYFTESNKKLIFSDSSKSPIIKDGKKRNYYNDSLPHDGKNKFKQIYEFAYGKYQERNETEYKMNLLREITTEYQKSLYLSKNKYKKYKEKEYFPSFDFLLDFMMKKKVNKGINQDIYKYNNINKVND